VPEIPRSQLAAYVALAVVIGLLGARYVRASGGSGGAAAGAGPASFATTATPASGSGGSGAVAFAPGGRSAVVHVAGAVRRPGVYELEAGARVQDAIRRAGGARARADLDAVNLAARLADGQQIVVPLRAAGPAGGVAAAAAVPGEAPSAPVSLGSATAEQLQTLDGVGPATAQKIIAYRQEHGGFRSVDDLANVPGIGPKKLAAMKPHVQP
jgi:competence protein ComEA